MYILLFLDLNTLAQKGLSTDICNAIMCLQDFHNAETVRFILASWGCISIYLSSYEIRVSLLIQLAIIGDLPDLWPNAVENSVTNGVCD